MDNPMRTLLNPPVRDKVKGKSSDGVRFADVDCVFIPSPHISMFHATIKWNGKAIGITPIPPIIPDDALPTTFVNEEALSKGQLKTLRPGDVISFHMLETTQPFSKWEVKRIAYGGLQPLTRSGNLEKEELARLRQIGANWSLDIPMVMVTVVAMAILGALVNFFLPDAGDDFIY